MQKSFLLLLLAVFLTAFSATAQTTKRPTGAAWDRAVKAYVAKDLEGIKKELPALEKAYSGNGYIQFFRALYNDMNGGDKTGSMRAYSEIIKTAPDVTDVYVQRAALFSDKGMYDRAVADMDKAIEIDGAETAPVWYMSRAEYRAFAGNNEGAMADFQQVIKMVPAHAPLYRGLANTARAAGKSEVAAAAFTSALAGGQKDNAGIRTAYGEFLLQEKRFADAETQYKIALAQSGFTPTAKDYNNAGLAAYKLKKLAEAARLFEKGMATDSKDVDIIGNRASVCIDQQDWECVYKYALQAISVNPQSAMANMYMAVGVKRTNRGDALAAEYEAKAKKLEQR